MPFCSNCGAQLEDNAKFCGNCGQAVEVMSSPAVVNAPVYSEPPAPAPTVPQEIPSVPAAQSDSAYSYSSSFEASAPVSEVPPYNTTGLMIWSILSLLFGALIFGILALMNTLQINKCTTIEEQQKKIRKARTWCIVSTVIGALVIISRMS